MLNRLQLEQQPLDHQRAGGRPVAIALLMTHGIGLGQGRGHGLAIRLEEPWQLEAPFLGRLAQLQTHLQPWWPGGVGHHLGELGAALSLQLTNQVVQERQRLRIQGQRHHPLQQQGLG